MMTTAVTGIPRLAHIGPTANIAVLGCNGQAGTGTHTAYLHAPASLCGQLSFRTASCPPNRMPLHAMLFVQLGC